MFGTTFLLSAVKTRPEKKKKRLVMKPFISVRLISFFNDCCFRVLLQFTGVMESSQEQNIQYEMSMSYIWRLLM